MRHEPIDRRYEFDANTRWACTCGYDAYNEDHLNDHLAAMSGPDAEPDVPFVAIGPGERAPWDVCPGRRGLPVAGADLPLTCPECGEGPLPLHDIQFGHATLRTRGDVSP